MRGYGRSWRRDRKRARLRDERQGKAALAAARRRRKVIARKRKREAERAWFLVFFQWLRWEKGLRCTPTLRDGVVVRNLDGLEERG
ncbi:MAG: hypothetical protein GC160_02815 [Acidobacteria bacterium]|nr:hypothetical protein [Acidobacteriota bacterium]